MSRKIKVLKNNPNLEGMARMIPNVVFSTGTGVELKMQILSPWFPEEDIEKQKRPLIVFLQGSAWTFPDVYYEIPQLSEFAKLGYVVATITHRSCLEGHPAPAFLQDAKTAIRFLRKNAKEYGIDPERVCFWGTSSGGNTSLLVALTGDDPRYKTDEYSDYSDKVSVAVDCFGPTDLLTLSRYIDTVNVEGKELFQSLAGGELSSKEGLIKEMSPLLILEKGKDYPPILILQGNADEVVPYSESENMFNALIDYNYDTEMICVENAPHEGSFWSRELIEEIKSFIKRKL